MERWQLRLWEEGQKPLACGALPPAAESDLHHCAACAVLRFLGSRRCRCAVRPRLLRRRPSALLSLWRSSSPSCPLKPESQPASASLLPLRPPPDPFWLSEAKAGPTWGLFSPKHSSREMALKEKLWKISNWALFPPSLWSWQVTVLGALDLSPAALSRGVVRSCCALSLKGGLSNDFLKNNGKSRVHEIEVGNWGA